LASMRQRRTTPGWSVGKYKSTTTDAPDRETSSISARGGAGTRSNETKEPEGHCPTQPPRHDSPLALRLSTPAPDCPTLEMHKAAGLSCYFHAIVTGKSWARRNCHSAGAVRMAS